MERAVVFAGFGGQGLLFAGNALAQAALGRGYQTLWIPSYGPEMRGGTASCQVIVGDGPISSPFVDRLDAAVVLNPPSLVRFLPRVAPGGVVVVNTTLVEAAVQRPDVRVVGVACTSEAGAAGGERLTAVVGLGALTEVLFDDDGRPVLSLADVHDGLRDLVERKHPELMAENIHALAAGASAAHAAATAHASRGSEARSPGARRWDLPG